MYTKVQHRIYTFDIIEERKTIERIDTNPLSRQEILQALKTREWQISRQRWYNSKDTESRSKSDNKVS